MADDMAGARSAGAVSSSEDALLLREFSHRAFNEVAVAASAVSLAARGAGGEGGAAFLAEAARRLDAVGALLRLLARPVATRVDLASELAQLCRAVGEARAESRATSLHLDLPETWVDGETARRITLVAAELIANAHRHALAGREGSLSVVLRRAGRELALEIRDDGGAVAPAASRAGLRLGGGIVADLVAMAGGRFELDRTGAGAVARLSMPIGVAQGMARAG